MPLPILEYQTLKGAHDALSKLGSAHTCCNQQTIKDWSNKNQLAEVRGFLGEAYADDALLRRAYLGDAFRMMGINEEAYKSSCARLARILDEAGKRPLTDADLQFARDALNYWSGLRAHLS
mgnify:FL=1